MKNFINIKVFIVCLVVSCFAYVWQYVSIYHIKHSLYPENIFGFLMVVLGFGFLFSVLIGCPILFLLRRYNLNSSLYFLFAGSISVGISVVIPNRLSLEQILQHPEGFIIGGLAGLLYWALAISKYLGSVPDQSPKNSDQKQ